MDLITSYQLLFLHQGSGCDRKQENFVLTNKMLADSMLIYSQKNIALIILCQFEVLNNGREYQEREEVKLCGSVKTDTRPPGASVTCFHADISPSPPERCRQLPVGAQLFLTSRPRHRG